MTRRSGWYWMLLTLLVLASALAHGGHPGAIPLQPTVQLQADLASGHHRHASSSQTQVEEHAHAPCVIPRSPDSSAVPGGVCERTPEDMSGSGTDPSEL